MNTSLPLRKALSGVLVIMQRPSGSDKTAVLEASCEASGQMLSLSSELQEGSVSFMAVHAF